MQLHARPSHVLRTAAAIALALAVGPLPAVADLEVETCSCDDIAQIQYRIMEDAAAIDAYAKYREDRTTPFTPNTASNYLKLQTFVQAALNEFAGRAKLESPLDAGEQAKTGFFDGKCQTYPAQYKVEPTPCMKAALDMHEAVHRRMCEELLLGRHVTLRPKIQEEIDAYTAEGKFLQDERQRLLCNCDYYAVKIERHDTLDYQAQIDHQTQDWLLHDSEDHPFVQIPLQLSAGKVSGDASGSITIVMGDTSKVTACDATHEPSPGSMTTTGEMAMSFKVSGMMAHEFTPTLTTDSGDLIGQLDCVNTHTERKSAVDQPLKATADMDLRFTKLDDVQESKMPLGNGGQSDFKTTLVLNERWINVKAKNGRGSTVEDGLRVIGLTDCADSKS
jgi:hypothetical protein